ncbi:hypothetical protein GC176_21045 [bacterium]|nr:hypothetical protein [bacterium]
MSDPAPTIVKNGDVTCICLGPEFENLDETLLDQIRDQLLDAAKNASPPLVVVDLQYTKFFGSSFIELLFRIWNRLNALPDGGFVIAGLADYCREVLEVTHLDKLWQMTATVDEAVALLAKK